MLHRSLVPRGLLAGLCAISVLPVLAQYGASAQSQHTNISFQIQSLRNSATPGADPRLLERQVSSLTNTFRTTRPSGAGAMNPEAMAMDRQMVQDATSALGSVEGLGVQDPGLRRALAGAYGAIGDYQTRPEYSSYGYNPNLAYGRASGLSRGLMLNGSDRNMERDVERYAMSMATWNAVNNRVWAGMGQMNQSSHQQEDQYDTGPTPPERKPLGAPDLDYGSLTPEQKETWGELRMQFNVVSQRIADAMRNLDTLTLRLRARGMAVNSADLATSYRMQGFLEDAFSYLSKKEFELGKEALTRADYERKRLRSITGQ